MKNFYLVFTILFLAIHSTPASAQDVYSSSGKPLSPKKKNSNEDKLINPDRLIFGGGAAFGLVSGAFTVGVSPILGYRITDDFSAGIGMGYQYTRVKNGLQIPGTATTPPSYANYHAHFFNPNVWLRYVLFRNIFAQAEYQQNILTENKYDLNTAVTPAEIIKGKNTFTLPRMLLGGGIRQPMGRNASFVIMALYDILDHPELAYNDRLVFRMGVNFGF